jgi:hypothetical protein
MKLLVQFTPSTDFGNAADPPVVAGGKWTQVKVNAMEKVH